MPQSYVYLPVDSATTRGGCYLTSVGTLRYAPGEAYPLSGHPPEFDFRWKRGRVLSDFALVVVTAGSGEWETRAARATVAGGDALYLVPGGWHRYRPLRDTGWTEHWLCLRGGALHEFVRAGLLPEACARLPGAVTRELTARLARLEGDVLGHPGENRPSWGARALAILLESFEGRRTAAALEPQDDATVARALRFIRDNSHRAIGVSDVAAHCGTHRRTLERRAAAAMAGTISQTIVLERIARAEVLLADTRLSVKEIAYACGFGSPHRMIYDFRRWRGVTPGAARLGKAPA